MEVVFVGIVYQKDSRSGITYAYDSVSVWNKELKQSRAKRKLIGRVDEKTGEIIPTDGRCRKNSPYFNGELTEEQKIRDRLKGMKTSELKNEIIRLESELSIAKMEIKRLKDGE